MDYVVGGVAALITGNVTPNRPRGIKKALTPVKHQTSPNVTPKSQLVDDKSMFLSPTLQKKKAIVKKSPKRIFQNDDINNSNEDMTISAKADKVKKHLKDDLESDNLNDSDKSKISPKRKHQEIVSPKKKKSDKHDSSDTLEVSPNKKSKQPNVVAENEAPVSKKSKKKKAKHTKVIEETKIEENDELPKKVSKKNKKNKKRLEQKVTEENKSKAKTDKETFVNPNAITQQDTDSEHESDNELASETEQDLKNSEDPEQSSDEEEPKDQKVNKKLTAQKTVENKNEYEPGENEIKRTIFVGNVPFSKKCKKEIKKIFSKHGTIESVRIRAVPVKDSSTTRKLAVIKNELHPDRSTVNIYVKYQDQSSIPKALLENNTLLGDCHLRVGRSDSTGAHDPRLALFVGNLPFSIEDETLRAKFEKCGDIQSVRIIRDKKTNIGKGFGYVNFASKDGVELALSLPEADLTIKNRILRVDRCKTQNAKKNVKQNKFGNRQRDFGKGAFPKTDTFEKQAKEQPEGAHRRIMNKRKSQDSTDAPPAKKQKDAGQPIREKKQRKEFVGITAEKKKKKNFNKGQKKKKIISELLSKKT